MVHFTIFVKTGSCVLSHVIVVVGAGCLIAFCTDCSVTWLFVRSLNVLPVASSSFIISSSHESTPTSSAMLTVLMVSLPYGSILNSWWVWAMISPVPARVPILFDLSPSSVCRPPPVLFADPSEQQNRCGGHTCAHARWGISQALLGFLLAQIRAPQN